MPAGHMPTLSLVRNLCSKRWLRRSSCSGMTNPETVHGTAMPTQKDPSLFNHGLSGALFHMLRQSSNIEWQAGM